MNRESELKQRVASLEAEVLWLRTAVWALQNPGSQEGPIWGRCSICSITTDIVCCDCGGLYVCDNPQCQEKHERKERGLT